MLCRALAEQLHCLLHRTLELRIPALQHLLGGVLDFDIRRDTLVLDRPLAVHVVERESWSRYAAAVDRRRNADRADEATPRARADQRAKLPLLEHVGKRVTARARRLVHDHHLRAEDPRHWRRDRLAVAHREI